MKQRSFSEWRFVGFVAVAMCLAAGLLVTYAAMAQAEEQTWRPVRFLDSSGVHRTPETGEGRRYMTYMAQRRVLEPVRQEPEARRVVASDWEVLDPIRYENLSVFPVVARQEYDTAGFLTLDEGLASGEVLVSERGSESIRRSRGDEAMPRHRQGGATVNTLVLVNRSKRPLLLLAGEVVTGGKQDRIIGKDRIVAPGAEPLPLDVFCVERGRWSAGNDFKAANLMAHPSVREKAAVAKDQSQVWGAVRSGSTSEQTREYAAEARAGRAAPATAPQMSADAVGRVMAEEARSESYAKVYKSRTVVASVDSFAAEVERRFRGATRGQRVIGVVVAYGGEVAWSDLFASQPLFQRYWGKLLRSYVVEALARPQLQERATVGDAARFLAPLDGHEQIETEPGVYRWRETSQGRLSQIEIESLLGKVFTLHRVKVQRTS